MSDQPKSMPSDHPVYAISSKHDGQIPREHKDHKAMIGHINSLNQSGHSNEARRLYDKHITGTGGAYTKGLKKCLETLNQVFKAINASD